MDIFKERDHEGCKRTTPVNHCPVLSSFDSFSVKAVSLCSYTISTSSEADQNDLITFGPVISPWMITYILVIFPSKCNILLTYRHHNRLRLIIVYEHSHGNSGLISQNDN